MLMLKIKGNKIRIFLMKVGKEKCMVIERSDSQPGLSSGYRRLAGSLGNRFLTHLSSFYSRVPNIFEIEK
jgi:hypothetical protein